MKKRMKLLSMLMIVMMVCTLVSNVFAADLGYVEAKLDKTVALEGNTVTLTIKALKPVTDYELRVTPTGEGMFEVVNKLQGSVANKSGNTRVLYMIQLAAQADKTVYPAGTELATLTYTIPEGFYAANKDAEGVAELGVNVAIKITDNGKNQSYTLTSAVKVKEAVYGDVTCDGVVDVTDTTHLSRHLEGTVTLDAQALKNADVNKDGNVNSEDVKLLGMYLASYFPNTLPEKPITDYVLYGDANRDGDITTNDTTILWRYLEGTEGVTLDAQALKNADVNKDGNINREDYQLLFMRTGGWFKGTLPEKPITDYILYGDVNCDGLVDTLDRMILTRYLDESYDQELSAQGLKNADVNNDGNINGVDRTLLSKVIANHEGYKDILPVQPITDYVLYGDVNCDGEITPLDATVLWNYILGNEQLSTQGLKNADVDKNGKVNYVDVELIGRANSGGYYDEQLPHEAITNHKLHLYNNELVYDLNEDNEAVVVFWPDKTKTKYFLPEKINGYTVVGIEDFPGVKGATYVLPSTIGTILEAIQEGNTIVTAKRVAVVENYAKQHSLTYIVASEILQERLAKITLENNVVGTDTTALTEIEIAAGLKVVVKNIAGDVLVNDDVMGTGTKLQVVDANNNVIYEKALSFNGEINGDGVIDFFDVVDLISLVYDMPQGYIWNEAVRSAAKFGAEGEVDFFDITTLISHIYDNN